MKQSASFSGNDVERISLNFSELREKGLKYIQELSGEVWTDYNSHDPGVTILEQLSYALTEIAYRTSLPVKDLLIPGKGLPIDVKSNAYFSPSAIFTSHPVTIKDTRKMIIDRFDEIQNVWIITKANKGYQEELRGVNKIEILPKIKFLNTWKLNPGEKKLFLKEVNEFLRENRNLGEKFESACLLKQQFIQIEFDIHINEEVDLDETLANVFLKLFEFIYCPVQFYSFNEMKEAKISMEEIFSGPLLKKGFLKDDFPDERLITIQVDELQRLFSKIKGINKSDVKFVDYKGTKYSTLKVGKNKFFHLLTDEDSGNVSNKRFDSIHSHMNVFINNKKLSSINKQSVNNLFLELWSKKNRGYSLDISRDDVYDNKLNGNFRNLGEYYSVQRHFPVIYGIGEEGISKNEPPERHAKALQLKAYLMLAEQHMANHLSQLGNLNEFFNIDFENSGQRTYFTQKLSSVPDIDKLLAYNPLSPDTDLEPETVLYNRKNRIYDHLLARFGEDFSDIPWQISLRLNIIKTVNEFNRILLSQKSQFLLQLEQLSYNRTKGESLQLRNNEEFDRIPSGLEQIILAKTGIQPRTDRSLIHDFSGLNSHLSKYKEEPLKSNDEFNLKYRPLRANEIYDSLRIDTHSTLPEAMFGEIGLKALFKETLNHENYWLSIPDSSSDKVHVIFQKAPNKWVSLFETSGEEEAVQHIFSIIDFFVEKGAQSEGLYLVDHILLSDFIKKSKYGFCFLDEYGNPLFRTIEEDSWCTSEAKRNKRIAEFYEYGVSANSYVTEEGIRKIKNKQGAVLASIDSNTNDTVELFKQTKSLIQLFSGKENKNGSMRLQEVEKIRLKGILEIGNKKFGQRRLVFQRKLSSGEIIEEDFFDLNISLVLPDWPARFQEERFKDYVTDVFYERMPAHLSNEILWINANEMKEFEEKYHTWEKLKAGLKNYDETSGGLKHAAFEVYQQIIKLKKNR